MQKRQTTFAFGDSTITTCDRCAASCRIEPILGSQARMLKRGNKGLCINCAVHDQLRHLYPANLTLARSGPHALLLPHIQKQFFEICRHAGTDATFEEINWGAIVANWKLPFGKKVRCTPTNPVTDKELAAAQVEGEQRRAGTWKEPPTQEEYEAKQQVAVDELLAVMQKERNSDEDPQTDSSDG